MKNIYLQYRHTYNSITNNFPLSKKNIIQSELCYNINGLKNNCKGLQSPKLKFIPVTTSFFHYDL